MAVRIRLLRMGKIHTPQYRIVVADARKKRDGRAIENVGIYHPKEEPSRIEVNSERVQYWLSVGAQPSEPVRAILRKTGDWQKFKGLTPPSNPVKVAAPKVDQRAVYDAEAKAAAGLADKPGKGEADQPAKKATKRGAKKAAPKVETAKAEPAKAEPAKAEPAKAEPAKAAAAGEAKADTAEAPPAAAAPEAAAPEAAAPEAAAPEPGDSAGQV